MPQVSTRFADIHDMVKIEFSRRPWTCWDSEVQEKLLGLTLEYGSMGSYTRDYPNVIDTWVAFADSTPVGWALRVNKTPLWEGWLSGLRSLSHYLIRDVTASHDSGDTWGSAIGYHFLSPFFLGGLMEVLLWKSHWPKKGESMIYVDSTRRRQGIGRSLLHMIEQDVGEPGTVWVQEEVAAAFYTATLPPGWSIHEDD